MGSLGEVFGGSDGPSRCGENETQAGRDDGVRRAAGLSEAVKDTCRWFLHRELNAETAGH